MTETADPRLEARRWLRYAWEDLAAAESMLQDPGSVPRHVCWLAQQAVEKALKACLVLQQIDFRRSHDLDALRQMLPGDWRANQEHPDLAALTEWAVESRYPGAWPDAAPSDATTAVEQARAVWASVVQDLQQRGVMLKE